MERIFFQAGPTTLPKEVMKRAKSEWDDFKETGLNIMEHSHRGATYEEIHEQAKTLMRKLLDIPETHDVLFLQGGASLQFAMLPMNLLGSGKTAKYVLTGSWSEKAFKEATKIGSAEAVVSGKETDYRSLPEVDYQAGDQDAYLHITSNNTIYGTQWPDLNAFSHPTLVADMSSDIMSKPFDVSNYALIYAGAQKNLGPAGVTAVIIRKDLLKEDESLPSILSYHVHAKSRSLYNTPPTYSIYLLNLVLQWIDEQGGVKEMETRNRKKADIIYQAIDSSGFYNGYATPESRSHMNVTFTLENSELEKTFIKESEENGIFGLKGHRSVGGFRASIYNAVSKKSCEKLADFMHNFQEKYGK
ncbi:3-phosphoserine/phosphohydroxythreonine transaminase [Fictibacillus phosphorivorans]|uniref:3-phosphoserine/phosphohydroxythreonine transaminase n=1 Tax=Fictibacillus phosphorivorans TaxID=1221500 RepID=UPI0020406C02|nr:3-phosphoserine/phosphohydroxythreonine transaminase [Fictibacillus phosphorivorans]MCM3717492.1 3-phosphoserine/phosphohydroxythreonine transaminase [Fictibacillus phosphorivorans]MCM3775187.1 3-phosphoserine/phosphohydroxythreonine transaminase [Fictibacillus phosphorivorans]